MTTESGDYKNKIYVLADGIAREKHGMGFYDLDDRQQDKVYYLASLEYFDREAERENSNGKRNESAQSSAV